MDQEKIGRLITQLRKEQKMTQEQLAERLEVSNRSVSRWENGTTMPDLPMFYRLSAVLKVGITELLSGERMEEGAGGDKNERMNLVIRLAEEEKMRKAKKLNRYFISGLLCLLLLLFLESTHLLRQIGPKSLRVFVYGTLLAAGLVLEAAGFWLNGKSRKLTVKEAEAYAGSERNVSLTDGREMLQFARRHQKAEFKQYEKAFAAIAKALLPDEKVRFSMVAESYAENGISSGVWHLGIAVTQERLLIGGERVAGRLMTRYGVDSFALAGLDAAAVSGKNIVVDISGKKLTIEGGDAASVFAEFQAALGR